MTTQPVLGLLYMLNTLRAQGFDLAPVLASYGLSEAQLAPGARIDRARHLLETTELPLKTVAFHAGFGSVRHMRFLFSEKLGLTPTQYRQQFS